MLTHKGNQMHMTSIFITATDTDAGKTYVTSLLYEYAQSLELQPAVFKPIASGCDEPGQPLSNMDIFTLHSLDPQVPVSALNQWCFDEPIAPHIAAEKQGVSLCAASMSDAMGRLQQERSDFRPYDLGFVEGAGGWALPLNNSETLDEWVVDAGLPVILVVGMKLGCLNHAVLTARAMVEAGAQVLGWVANSSELMPSYDENLHTLTSLLPFQLLVEVFPGQKSLAKNSTALEAVLRANAQGV